MCPYKLTGTHALNNWIKEPNTIDRAVLKSVMNVYGMLELELSTQHVCCPHLLNSNYR